MCGHRYSSEPPGLSSHFSVLQVYNHLHQSRQFSTSPQSKTILPRNMLLLDIWHFLHSYSTVWSNEVNLPRYTFLPAISSLIISTFLYLYSHSPSQKEWDECSLSLYLSLLFFLSKGNGQWARPRPLAKQSPKLYGTSGGVGPTGDATIVTKPPKFWRRFAWPPTMESGQILSAN